MEKDAQVTTAELNKLRAKFDALERLVLADVAERWTDAQAVAWNNDIIATNDAAASPSETNRANWTLALDRLAILLRKMIGRAAAR